ncbi:peptidoglycan-binding domain-containing protein [Methylopila sp. 73B]|uniref:peptidoglycan-binding domain-containing protein n=1 Tax=Methylopila sp. 73B TaxID=1120792 RepID=UPI000360FDEC|nr:peptidoglycan-binding domain-containing protein [Methylopila sp. 73B]
MPKPSARSFDAHDSFGDRPVRGGIAELVRRRPVDVLAGLVAAAGVATILVNALLLQEGRHPAPFFGEHPAVTPAAAPARPTLQRSELVAQIQEALRARGDYDGPVDGLIGARTAAAIASFERGADLPIHGEPNDRVLAALLIAPAKPTPQPAPAAATKPSAALRTPVPAPSPSPTVTGSTSVAGPKMMAVQRALSKLGYGPVASDGKMGAATRNALQEFERDRKLPVTGEPNPQTLRQLQAVFGAPLE